MKFINKILFIYLTLCLLKIFVNSEKILFLSTTPSVSHQKPLHQIWKALSLRGHQVHVLTASPLNDPSLTNLTEYDLSSLFVTVFERISPEYIQSVLKTGLFFAFLRETKLHDVYSMIYEETLNHEETLKLLKNNMTFDLVMTEWLYPTMTAFGAYYKCPIIGVASLGVPVMGFDTVGNPSHPVINPDHNLPVSRDMYFLERVSSVLYATYMRFYNKFFILPYEDQLVRKYLGNDLPYLGDIERNVSLLLLNRNPVFHRPIPVVPAVIELGSIKFKTDRVKLDSDTKRFVDSSTRGVIYLSFGSVAKSILLPTDKIEVIKEAFRNLPYDVVWKWEDDVMANQPKNVFIRKWIAQESLLRHPNVKLFITQGGLQSTEEAIANHKPIIGIPLFADQPSNVYTCVKYGMAKLIWLDRMTSDKLTECILDVMNNYTSYKENARKLDELIKDQPTDAIEKAIWWTEYVMRHKGASHLRSIAVDMPWWKYFFLDVIFFLLLVILLVVFLVYWFFKCLYNLVSMNRRSYKMKGD